MKKTVLILLAMTLIIVLAGCGASEKAQGNPAAESGDRTKKSSESQNVPEEMGDLLAKAYTDILQSGSYLLHYQGTVSAEGMIMEVETVFATDGETISTTTVSEQYTAHTLIKDGVCYSLDDTAKTYTVVEMSPELAEPFSGEAMEYVGTGTATVDGKEMEYEEYQDGVGVMRFYFDEKTLYAIAQRSGEGEMVFKVLELSGEVTPDMLSIPADYTQSGAAGAPGSGLQGLPEEAFEGLSPEERAALEEAMGTLENYGGGQQS